LNALERFVRLAAALLAIAATGAQAGGPLSICNDPGKTPLAYSPATVSLNYDLGSLGSRSKAQADTIVTNAVALWTNVGTATIAAFIGAGGYGERIASGLALNDHTTLLAGALPAAALALLVQGLFELAEWRFGWMAKLRRR